MSFKERKPNFEDPIDLEDTGIKEIVESIETLKPGESYKKEYRASQGTNPMQRYITALQNAGLDIGRGNAKFGYRMPLPEKDAYQRYLVIFRRD